MQKIAIARPEIGLRERLAVDAVLRSGMLAQGALVARFEAEFASATGTAEAIAVNSGTSGLHLSLLALGVGPGDEVIVPAFTFAATANSVAMTGATPVFADIDPSTFTVATAEVEARITPRTVGILPVHLYGLGADMKGLKALALKNGLFILEDAAQAHLASVHGESVGGIGNAGVFSFYPTKNMTTGEGGIITTNDSELAKKIRMLRNQGMVRRYEHIIPGLNNRMTEISAAIGLEQLKRLPKWTEKRIENAQFLLDGLDPKFTQVVPDGFRHVYHQLTLRVPLETRDAVRSDFERQGIATDIYYPAGIDSLPPYFSGSVLPLSQKASQEVFSIPVRPSLTRSELKRIKAAVNTIGIAR